MQKCTARILLLCTISILNFPLNTALTYPIGALLSCFEGIQKYIFLLG